MNAESLRLDSNENQNKTKSPITRLIDHSQPDVPSAPSPVEDQPKFVQSLTTYEMIEEIARGGMGVIYRAMDLHLNREVAIKVMMPQHAKQPSLVSRFLNESRIMCYLRHPGITEIYECGLFEDWRPFYSMRLITGATLEDLINQKSNESSFARKMDVFAFVCQILAYTHTMGIVHLDVKPSNIMAGSFGEIQLMDWGLAMIQRGGGSGAKNARKSLAQSGFMQPNYGQVQGTPQYMSPEQALGEPLDTQADVFSLGTILFEILTGKPVYQGKNWKEIYRKARSADLTEAMAALDKCVADSRLIRLAKLCLSASPANRPPTANEVSHELTDYHQSALTRVENDMSRFFELSLDLFCIAGLDGFFRRINPNFSRVLGYSEEELMERPFLDLVHEDDRVQTMITMSVLQEGQPVVRFRNRYRASNGEYVVFEWTAKSVPEESLIFAVARNVT